MISGTMPPFLYDLRFLNLQNSYVSGTLLPVADWSKWSNVLLGSTRLSGTISPVFDLVKYPPLFSLANASISGKLPSYVYSGHGKMNSLYLGHNKLSGTVSLLAQNLIWCSLMQLMFPARLIQLKITQIYATSTWHSSKAPSWLTVDSSLIFTGVDISRFSGSAPHVNAIPPKFQTL